MTDRSNRMQEFEALRGLAILLLLALHSEVFDASVFGFEVDPLAGVVASLLLGSFFFLAGFFAEYSRSKAGGTLFSFLWSKFIRIFPPYWLALALFVVVLGFSLKRFDMLAYVLNLQWLLSPVFIKPLLTIWYISVLVGYYLIFGSLSFLIKPNLWFFVSAFGVFGVSYAANAIVGLFEPRFFQYFFIFLAGIFFYRFEHMRDRLMNLGIFIKVVAAIVFLLVFWRVAGSGLASPHGLFILTADLFILAWVWMLLSLFRLRIGGWRIWAFLSTASFFTYLYHRPIWKVFEIVFGLEPGVQKIFVNLIPGSLVALLVGYILQRGYDRLLSSLRLKP
ncbi:MAG TPA: acyltransferase [Anaerolineales bacterium]|nr:acyltransferase [Anaerolineales bacterium]